MQFPIVIGVHRSRFLDLAVLMLALLASASIVGFLAERLIQAALLFATWILAVLAWRNLKPYFQLIRLERSGHVLAAPIGNADLSRVKLEPISTVHPWLTVIRLKTESGLSKSIILTVDSLLSADFRRLRVFIRWRGSVSEPGDDA